MESILFDDVNIRFTSSSIHKDFKVLDQYTIKIPISKSQLEIIYNNQSKIKLNSNITNSDFIVSNTAYDYKSYNSAIAYDDKLYKMNNDMTEDILKESEKPLNRIKNYFGF